MRTSGGSQYNSPKGDSIWQTSADEGLPDSVYRQLRFFVLPNTHDGPPSGLEPSISVPITSDIVRNFLTPEHGVGLWNRIVHLTAMPKASAVNEDRHPGFWEEKICSSPTIHRYLSINEKTKA
jgi:hypothetical protein